MLSKARLLAVTLLFICATFVIATGNRFFPFSDYPMFSDVKTSPSIRTLMVVDEKQNRTPLRQSESYPFTRLHLQQFARLANESHSGSSGWLNFFLTNARRHRGQDVKLELGVLTINSSGLNSNRLSIEDFHVEQVWPGAF